MRKEVTATKKYWFVWNEELNNSCAFDAFLFNDPAHLGLQPCKNRYSYYLIKKHDEVVYARCTFFIEEGIAYSPYKSSFGSIEFSDKVFFELLEEFWDLVEEDLKAKGAKEIMIKNYPVCYHPAHAQLLSYLFSTKGFSIKTQEFNFHIEVDERGFEEKVHSSERSKIHTCLKSGYTFLEEKEFDLKDFFLFHKNSKKRKNLPVTMKFEELEKIIDQFPDKYKLFSLTENAKRVAVILTVQVNSSILYTFYNAEDDVYLKNSPIVYLHQYIYNFCKIERIKMIDFGIGSANGTPNKGLIRFKEKLGGIYTMKTIFTKLRL